MPRETHAKAGLRPLEELTIINQELTAAPLPHISSPFASNKKASFVCSGVRLLTMGLFLFESWVLSLITCCWMYNCRILHLHTFQLEDLLIGAEVEVKDNEFIGEIRKSSINYANGITRYTT